MPHMRCWYNSIDVCIYVQHFTAQSGVRSWLLDTNSVWPKLAMCYIALPDIQIQPAYNGIHERVGSEVYIAQRTYNCGYKILHFWANPQKYQTIVPTKNSHLKVLPT